MSLAPSPRRVCFTLAVLAAALSAGGCGEDGSPIASTQPIASATAAEAVPTLESGHGNSYVFTIRYPETAEVGEVLAHALREFAAERRREFLAAIRAEPRCMDPEHECVLDLAFDVSRRTSAFVSVLTNGLVYVGGAHPDHVVASFNLHAPDQKVVSIADLFTDPDVGLKALSDEARRQLEGRFEAGLRDQIGDDKTLASQLQTMREWVEKGTAPKVDNFSVFLVDGLDAPAIGLTLIFPRDQVAASVAGEAQVEVPAPVFYELLKPEFRPAFAPPDAALDRPAVGVR
jgi:hypothetical protein